MDSTQDYTIYDVERTEPSASAIVIFAHRPQTGRNVVLKILKEMQDKRYDLSTPEKRQKCQIRALAWNPEFTSGVYLGLVPIRETPEELERKMNELDEIGVGPVLDSPKQLERFSKEKEYVLLMRRLPEDRRLDTLLAKDRDYDGTKPIPSYLLLLLQRIHEIHKSHKDFPTFGVDEDESEVSRWGSVEQLHKKLQENLRWLEDEEKSKLAGIKGLSDICARLTEKLPEVFKMEKYRKLFERRSQEGHIKHCHGDLKANNIWIEVGEPQCEEQSGVCIRILDCIDFKLSYCMIDTLSDIALLVADIQARTGNLILANTVIDEYLIISGEDRQEAHDLLAYYLVEKAMIGMLNGYIDDKDEELGERYKDVVNQRLDELVKEIYSH